MHHTDIEHFSAYPELIFDDGICCIDGVWQHTELQYPVCKDRELVHFISTVLATPEFRIDFCAA